MDPRESVLTIRMRIDRTSTGRSAIFNAVNRTTATRSDPRMSIHNYRGRIASSTIGMGVRVALFNMTMRSLRLGFEFVQVLFRVVCAYKTKEKTIRTSENLTVWPRIGPNAGNCQILYEEVYKKVYHTPYHYKTVYEIGAFLHGRARAQGVRIFLEKKETTLAACFRLYLITSPACLPGGLGPESPS